MRKFVEVILHSSIKRYRKRFGTSSIMTEPVHDEMVLCPYDATHLIEQYRMHIHLQKCRKQHPDAQRATCPFDATHLVTDVELDYHVTVCPKRQMLDSLMFVVDDEHRPQVTVQSSVPTSVDPSEELWDNENTQTYKPDPAKKGAHMIVKIKGATASERRKARMECVQNYRPPDQ